MSKLNRTRKEKIELLEGIKKGKASADDLAPAMNITFMYMPSGYKAAISTCEGQPKTYRRFTDATKQALIEEVKSQYPDHRLNIAEISEQRCREIQQYMATEY